MKKINWPKKLFIATGCIMIFSFLFIITESLFLSPQILPQPMKQLNRTTQVNNFLQNLHPQEEDSEWLVCWNSLNERSPLFTSRNYFSKNEILVDLLESDIQLHPPVQNKWLIDHHLDYADPNILSEDLDGDGFTNLEEWLGSDPQNAPGSESSDPNDPESHPLLWTKLRCHSSSIYKNSYAFSFTGVDTESPEQLFQLQPKNPTPNLNPQGKKVLNTKIRYVKLGAQLEGLPLQVLSFNKKQTIYHEIPYDISELILTNPLTAECWTLIKKSTLHPEATAISILEGISFEYTLVSPAKKITLNIGNTFTLESLPIPEGKRNSGQKSKELYRLVSVTNKEAVLEKEEKRYSVIIIQD